MPPTAPSPPSVMVASDLRPGGESEDLSNELSFSSLPRWLRGGMGLEGGVWYVSCFVSVPFGDGVVDPRRLSDDVAGEAEREEPCTPSQPVRM